MLVATDRAARLQPLVGSMPEACSSGGRRASQAILPPMNTSTAAASQGA